MSTRSETAMIGWKSAVVCILVSWLAMAIDLKHAEIGNPFVLEQARGALGISAPCTPGANAGEQLCDGETTIDEISVKTPVRIGVSGNVELISLKFGSVFFELLEKAEKFGKPTSMKNGSRTICIPAGA
jgi:hypothetical protein